MQAVRWGEYKVGDVLDWMPQKEIDPLKLKSLTVESDEKYPFYGQATINNGVISYESLIDSVLNNKSGLPTILVHSNNQNVVYVETPFYLKDGHGATSVLQSPKLNKENAMFLMSAISKVIVQKFSYQAKATKIALKNTVIHLPVTADGKIDFDFMESFIRELEEERIRELEEERIRELKSYLAVTGLQDYTLTVAEQTALNAFDSLAWQEFRYDEIFNHIEQGRRLKKDDQKPGSIPFVMSGITNTGVVNYISNPVASFPANSITVDIFGNTFYRSFAYGLGDDTGAYWNDQKEYTKEQMLFFATAVGKSLEGKYSYGHKLRSSQSLGFKMFLPVKNGEPDFDAMDTCISAVQKLVIKDVVKYADKKIAATKEVVEG